MVLGHAAVAAGQIHRAASLARAIAENPAPPGGGATTIALLAKIGVAVAEGGDRATPVALAPLVERDVSDASRERRATEPKL